jgi:hypothetical protein
LDVDSGSASLAHRFHQGLTLDSQEEFVVLCNQTRIHDIGFGTWRTRAG